MNATKETTRSIKAIMCCVDYWDILAVTLPRIREHIDRVTVITTPADTLTQEVVASNKADVFITDSFYARGAKFAKWAAMEEGLDYIGRSGWIAIMDADILLPRKIVWPELAIGNLYTPLRRMVTSIPKEIPPDEKWIEYPLHPQQTEWAGYFQLANANDPVLGPPPWHDVGYASAGTADSWFQEKWPRERKLRPPFEVLHIGPSGVNWCGRVTPYADGTIPEGAEERKSALRDMLLQRRGKVGMARFDHEKLTGQ